MFPNHKKPFYLLFVLIHLFFGAFGQQKHFMEHPLFGKVKSITYSPNFQLLNLDLEENKRYTWAMRDRLGEYKRLYEFDENGNIISEKGLDWNFERKYNSNNQLIEVRTISYSRGFVSSKTQYRFNNKKQLISELNYTNFSNKECLTEKTTYLYDNKNNLIQKTIDRFDCIKENQTLKQQLVYIYSYTSFNKLGLTSIKENNALIPVEKYSYDSKQRKISQINYSRFNNFVAKTIYEYDNLGNVKLITRLNGDKLIENEVNIYDSKSRLTERNITEPKFLRKIKFQYDQQNRLISETHFLDNKLAYTKKYNMDKLGNIIEVHYFDSNNKVIVKYTNIIAYAN